jgi:hypothetical protein
MSTGECSERGGVGNCQLGCSKISCENLANPPRKERGRRLTKESLPRGRQYLQSRSDSLETQEARIVSSAHTQVATHSR